MMPTKNEYYQTLPPQSAAIIEYARVVAFAENGEPLLQFTGETVASPKSYVRMRHYDDPRIGDRVLVLNNIIMGTWSNA